MLLDKYQINIFLGDKRLNRITALLCLLIGLPLVSIPSIAQPPDTLWTRTFGADDGEGGYNLQLTSDGGQIITGYTYSFGAGSSDLWLIKTDSDGNEIWNQTFGGAQSDVGHYVQQTMDGGYIIVGTTLSFGHGGHDVWLVKTDSEGNEQWNQTYGTIHPEKGYCVQQTTDGGYIITGSTDSNIVEFISVWLLKTDSEGSLQWSQTFEGIDGSGGKCVRQTLDGGFIIAGYTNLGANDSDVLLIKTDNAGNEIWTHTFGGTRHDKGYCVQLTSDEGYIITGDTSIGVGISGVLLIKTDWNGAELWSQTFVGENIEHGFELQQTQDNGFIIVGQAFSNDTSYDVLLIKTDSNGNQDWLQTFNGFGADEGKSVKQTSDGGYVVVGSTQINQFYHNVWLIRLAADGTEVSENITPIPTECVLEEIYPNPFNPSATISVTLPRPSDLRVSVFNTVGQEVSVLADGLFAQGHMQFTFDATGLSSGIYFVQATVPGQKNEMQKIVYMK
jgi:Secretion system C-terminal sorting domain